MRQVFVVTMPQVEFQPIIAFESETDAAEFARSMHYADTDAWKQDVHKCVYVPMSFTERMAWPEYIEEQEEVM